MLSLKKVMLKKYHSVILILSVKIKAEEELEHPLRHVINVQLRKIKQKQVIGHVTLAVIGNH